MLTRASTSSSRHGFRLGGAFLLVACAAANAVAAVATTNAATNQVEIAAAVATSAADLAQKWGIQVSGLFLSAGGNMVDFRYKVLNPAKAALLTKPETKPRLLDQTSGAKLHVPDTDAVGQLRQTVQQPVMGKIYFMLFANTQHHVKSGDVVTISAGEFKAENLVVE